LEERRKEVRRKEDRQLLELFERLTGKKPTHLLRRRKKRRVIRRICDAKFVMESDQAPQGGVPAESTQREIACQLLDLSETGAMVFAKNGLGVGWKCRFVMQLFNADEGLIEATAEVRWSQRKDAKQGYAMGIQLSGMDERNQQRLKDFLAKLDSTLGL